MTAQRSLFGDVDAAAPHRAPAAPPPLRSWSFTVAGEPRPMGSKSAFVVKTPFGHRAVVTNKPSKGSPETAAKLPAWKDAVTAASMVELDDGERTRAPLAISLVFYLARPSGHMKPDGSLRKSAPCYPAVKPDVDKLIRSTLDALKVAMIADDAKVVALTARKLYADGRATGADISVEELDNP